MMCLTEKCARIWRRLLMIPNKVGMPLYTKSVGHPCPGGRSAGIGFTAGNMEFCSPMRLGRADWWRLGGWSAARSETREAWCLSITANFRVLTPETAYSQGQKADPKLFQGAVKNHAEADSATAAPPSGRLAAIGVTSAMPASTNRRRQWGRWKTLGKR